jgi:SAM-dependent methyltransferase
LAPGIPADYHRRIYEAEQVHWWHLGMLSIAAALLGDRSSQDGRRVLDAGCVTGGALRWQLDLGGVSRAAGIDISAAAIELARRRVPEADLCVAAVKDTGFEDSSFDLVLSHDVLQHIPEPDVDASLAELRRVLDPSGVLLIRTNGARTLRRERVDWRAYDRSELTAVLERAGFRPERVTYANLVTSAIAAATGRAPHAPNEERHGIPLRASSRLRSAVGASLLAAERRWLRRPGRTLPYGHTLFALAVPCG